MFLIRLPLLRIARIPGTEEKDLIDTVFSDLRYYCSMELILSERAVLTAKRAIMESKKLCLRPYFIQN